jgi:hypothetical protein
MTAEEEPREEPFQVEAGDFMNDDEVPAFAAWEGSCSSWPSAGGGGSLSLAADGGGGRGGGSRSPAGGGGSSSLAVGSAPTYPIALDDPVLQPSRHVSPTPPPPFRQLDSSVPEPSRWSVVRLAEGASSPTDWPHTPHLAKAISLVLHCRTKTTNPALFTK